MSVIQNLHKVLKCQLKPHKRRSRSACTNMEVTNLLAHFTSRTETYGKGYMYLANTGSPISKYNKNKENLNKVMAY